MGGFIGVLGWKFIFGSCERGLRGVGSWKIRVGTEEL